jgi:hypothetical protein
MKLSILTTLPHYIALFYTSEDIFYSTLIFLSTTFSVLWHFYNEPETTLKTLDYATASLVTLYEIYCKTQFISVLFLNSAVLALNKVTTPKSTGHLFWHLLSSAKYIYVAGWLH